MISFREVETSMAMLTITAKDADIPLGVSASLEVASLCKHDAMDDKEKFVTEFPIAILAEGQEATETASIVVAAADAAEEEQEKGEDGTIDNAKEEVKEAKEESTDVVELVQVEDVEASADETTTTDTAEEEEATTETAVHDDKPPTDEEKQVEPEAKQEVAVPVEVVAEEATATAVGISPVCTVVLRFTYSPSPKDRREELYELLNKTSQRKATALENLRRISMAAQSSPSSSPTHRTNEGGASGGGSSGVMTTNKPAVKAGFLNKGAKKVKEQTRMERIYDRVLGPNSILMRGIAIVTVGKNYIIFFGAMTFFHFQGQMLALPPPV
jgi:hypothetical protein